MNNNFVERERGNLFQLYQLDKYMVGHKGFIAGGCFKNLFNNERVKDLDIFFKNSTEHHEAVKWFTEHKDYVFSYRNEKVVAYKNIKTDVRVELINFIFGTAEEVISVFDFSITKFAFYKQTIKDEVVGDSIEYKVLHEEDFFEHLHMKRLVVEKEIKYPISTFERSLRYTKYGYGLCKESKANLLLAVAEYVANNKNSDILSKLSLDLYNGID